MHWYFLADVVFAVAAGASSPADASAATTISFQSVEACEPASDAPDASLEARMLSLSQEEAMADPAAAKARVDPMIAAAEGVCTEALVAAYGYRGTANFLLHQTQDALTDFEFARDRLAEAGMEDSDLMLQVLDNIASTLGALGQVERALVMKEEMLERIGERWGTESSQYADTLYGTGLNYYRLGNVQEALHRIQQAVWIKRALPQPETGPDVNVAVFWMSEGALLTRLGRVDEGLAATQGAALWAEEHLGSDHLVTVAALNAYGTALNDAGHFIQALPILRKTLALREKLVGPDHEDTAMSMSAVAFALEKLGMEREALELYLAASRIFQESSEGDSPIRAVMTLMNAANAEFVLGNWEAGDAHARRAAALLGEPSEPTRYVFGRVQMAIGSAHLRNGEFAQAREAFTRAADSFSEIFEDYHRDLADARVQRGLSDALAGNTAEALAETRPVFETIERYMLEVSQFETGRIRTEETYSYILVKFARLAFMAGDFDTGLRAFQLARLGDVDRSGRALAARSAAQNDSTAELVRELQDAINEEGRLRGEIASAVAESDVDARREAEAALAEASARASSLRKRVAELFPAFEQLSHPSLVDLADMQSSIAEDGAILFTQPGPAGILSVAVTREGVAWHFAPRERSEYLDAVLAIRDSVQDTSQPFAMSEAHILYAAIFGGDIAPLLEGKQHLDVLAGGYLSVIPFSLLVERAPAPGEGLADAAWLVRRFAISMPLDLGHLAPDARAGRPVRFAGFGDPALAPPEAGNGQFAALARSSDVTVQDLRELPSLPGAGRELAAMADALENADNLLLTRERATESAIRATDLTQFTVIAFATHGLVGGQIGGLDEPALVMTPPEGVVQGDDGLLTASEIARLRLNADWVILSACNTASGSNAGTPTYSGLAQAFVFAGARSLLLSHWRVRDDAAARLSVETVRGAARGLDKAEALREAQLELMADPDIPDAAHPAVWAPFILIES